MTLTDVSKGLKVLILSTDCIEFRCWLYAQHPGLEREPYENQARVRRENLFDTADFYSSNLRKLGCEVREIRANNLAREMNYQDLVARKEEQERQLAAANREVDSRKKAVDDAKDKVNGTEHPFGIKADEDELRRRQQELDDAKEKADEKNYRLAHRADAMPERVPSSIDVGRHGA